jgi:hypothetical protein
MQGRKRACLRLLQALARLGGGPLAEQLRMVRSKAKKARASGKAPRPVATTDTPPIITATNDYERWLHKRLDVVEQELPRYVAAANCNGGLAAREAKAWLPSA